MRATSQAAEGAVVATSEEEAGAEGATWLAAEGVAVVTSEEGADGEAATWQGVAVAGSSLAGVGSAQRRQQAGALLCRPVRPSGGKAG